MSYHPIAGVIGFGVLLGYFPSTSPRYLTYLGYLHTFHCTSYGFSPGYSQVAHCLRRTFCTPPPAVSASVVCYWRCANTAELEDVFPKFLYPTKKNSPIWIGVGRPDLSRSENLHRGSKSCDIMRLYEKSWNIMARIGFLAKAFRKPVGILNVPKMYHKYSNNVTKMYQKCFKDVAKMCHISSTNAPKMYHKWTETDRVNSCRDVSKIIPRIRHRWALNISKSMRKTYQKRSKNVPNMCQKYV